MNNINNKKSSDNNKKSTDNNQKLLERADIRATIQLYADLILNLGDKIGNSLELVDIAEFMNHLSKRLALSYGIMSQSREMRSNIRDWDTWHSTLTNNQSLKNNESRQKKQRSEFTYTCDGCGRGSDKPVCWKLDRDLDKDYCPRCIRKQKNSE